MINTSAILLVTDSASIERLQNSGTWPQVALRYEDMANIDQVLFLDRDQQAITHMAILSADEPWVPTHVKGQPLTFIPQVEEVMDMFDPIEVSNVSLELMGTMGRSPLLHREALLIADIDEMLNAEDPEAWVLGEIADQVIINGRNFDTSSALRALEGELGDVEALAREFTEVSAGIEGEQMDKLPTNWAKGWNQTEEQQAALLSLLNSAMSTYMAETAEDWSI